MTFITHDEASELIDALGTLSTLCPVKDAYWISTPDGDHEFDDGTDCCADCGTAELAKLKAADAENADDYMLDGGWVSEHDTPPHCAVCGAKLHASLTTAGGLYELNHFASNAPTPGNVEHAYEISEMLYAFHVTSPKNADSARQAIEIARVLVAANLELAGGPVTP